MRQLRNENQEVIQHGTQVAQAGEIYTVQDIREVGHILVVDLISNSQQMRTVSSRDLCEMFEVIS